MRAPWRRQLTGQARWEQLMAQYRKDRKRGKRDVVNPWTIPPSAFGPDHDEVAYKAFLNQFDWHTGERKQDA